MSETPTSAAEELHTTLEAALDMEDAGGEGDAAPPRDQRWALRDFDPANWVLRTPPRRLPDKRKSVALNKIGRKADAGGVPKRPKKTVCFRTAEEAATARGGGGRGATVTRAMAAAIAVEREEEPNTDDEAAPTAAFMSGAKTLPQDLEADVAALRDKYRADAGFPEAARLCNFF